MMAKESLRRTICSPVRPLKSTMRSARSAGASNGAVERYRRRQQALVGTDLMKRLPVGERQVEEAAVRGVQHAEAVPARLYVEERKRLAIDQHHVAENSGTHGRAASPETG